MIQDIYPHKLDNSYRPDYEPAADSKVLLFQADAILIKEEAGILSFPCLKELQGSKKAEKSELVYAFSIDEEAYFLDISGTRYELEGYTYRSVLRDLRPRMDHVQGMISFTGSHLYQWYSENRFCGSCGRKMLHDETERAMKCPACGKKRYPQLMPAVIVGVIDRKTDKILLTKYREGYKNYALVAGFAEIGETLEECVKREVLEETGIQVTNIRYYKSQPWGVAKDLLAGFFCDLEGSSKISMDEGELKLAQWTSRDEVELQENDFSLTNEMMEQFKKGAV